MTGLDDAADELYAGPPGEFIARRDAAVKQARAEGDRELAKAIAALRKPTVAAWVVNAMMRDDAELPERLLQLGDSLREAEQTLDGAAMRALSGQRRGLVRSLVKQARTLAADLGQPVTEAVAQEIDATLTAALADPAIAEEVTSGRLTAARSYSGFGSIGLDPAGVSGGTGQAGNGDGERHLTLVRPATEQRTAPSKPRPVKARSAGASPAPSDRNDRNDRNDQNGEDDEKAKARRERERAEAEKREAARLAEERRREAERAEEDRLRAEAQAVWQEAQDAADQATAAHEAALDRRDELVEQLAEAEAALKAAERELKATRGALKTAKARRDLLGRGSDR